jgi:hypothetical protein
MLNEIDAQSLQDLVDYLIERIQYHEAKVNVHKKNIETIRTKQAQDEKIVEECRAKVKDLIESGTQLNLIDKPKIENSHYQAVVKDSPGALEINKGILKEIKDFEIILQQILERELEDMLKGIMPYPNNGILRAFEGLKILNVKATLSIDKTQAKRYAELFPSWFKIIKSRVLSIKF